MQNQNITLTELITRATEHLCSLNYSKGTISQYQNTWNLLKKYARGKGVSIFSLEVGMQFLSDHYNIGQNTKLPHFHISLVRRIKVLAQLSKNLFKIPRI